MASTEPNQGVDLKDNQTMEGEAELSIVQQQPILIVNWKHIAHCMKHEMFELIGLQTMAIIEQMPPEKVNDLSPAIVDEVIAELRRVRGREFIYNHEVFIYEMVNRAKAFNAVTTCAAPNSLVINCILSLFHLQCSPLEQAS